MLRIEPLGVYMVSCDFEVTSQEQGSEVCILLASLYPLLIDLNNRK